ncbi:MAG: RNA methyltransferase [Pegethrix bostrychoides GSE-TBD4-15B]|uniref:RNA methyltransferase n=1 Tax=Pegethrix bostrychoides GSE-TBD4-15B TaxID=2839662 RepID=A0A951P829_9CYAN|nr:RNA methyltransferase [Pegethrix bostrychoides GSE-TBD4-15B]
MLTSLQNPLIKQMRKLHQAKARREQALFLLEGTHLLQEACALGYPLQTVCYTADWQQQHLTLWQQIKQQAARVELVSPAVLQAVATTVNPDGVVAAAPHRLSWPQRPIEQPFQLGLALEAIQDPGNLGAIFRTAAAVEVDQLWLGAESVDLENPKLLRASAGQWFRLPIQPSLDLASELSAVQAAGVQVIATSPTAALTYWQVDFSCPSLVLLGNEGVGLSAELMQLADLAVQIPLAAGVESLNVAVAAALMLYEARRQTWVTSAKP